MRTLMAIAIYALIVICALVEGCIDIHMDHSIDTAKMVAVYPELQHICDFVGASKATPTSTATVDPTSQPNHLSDSWISTSRAASDDARDKAVKWMFRGMIIACLIFVAEIAYLWRERIAGGRKERKYGNQ